MQIYVATHKPAPFPEDSGYIPIQNGKAISELDLGILGDDTGRNISEKMPTFSECCTLYWMAENVQAELIGLAHYRRYFRPVNYSTRVGEFEVAATNDFPELSEADLIVSHLLDLSPHSVESQYAASHFERDLSITRGAIRKLHPDYLDTFDRVLEGQHLTPYNLFVGRKEVVRAFTRWMFDILFLLEGWIPYKTYDNYQQRVFAFLSERLFTTWLRHNEGNWRIRTRSVMALSY